MLASSIVSPKGLVRSDSRSRVTSRTTSSFCALIEMYSPAAIDTAPARSPAKPATRTNDAWVEAPAKPRMSATFETRPSLTPNTAARDQPPCTSRCW